MIKKFSLLILASLMGVSLSAQSTTESSKPRLVVNIVVGGMRANDIRKYYDNFSDLGFKRLYNNGMRFDDCLYSYQQTTTPVSLATLTTGAQPSTHGIVSDSWYDYVINKEVSLIEDNSVINIEYNNSERGYSPNRLIATTLTQTLRSNSPESQSVTIAIDPLSSIVMNGKGGNCLWIDSLSCSWSSSTAYANELPQWVTRHNKSEVDIAILDNSWSPLLKKDRYLNSNNGANSILGEPYINYKKKSKSRADRYRNYFYKIAYTPAGNNIVSSFAKTAIANLNLGGDSTTDILNICYDTSRNIIMKYGPESVEAEDMFYRLDSEIGDLISFIQAQVKDKSVVFVLTSDHGTSPSCDITADDAPRFNVRQFEVILNGFLSARYGQENWILGCNNRNIYLNHNVIYAKNLSLTEVQNETASFAMQFRGISHALTATAMRSSYFGSGYAQLMQNSFYPRRSGDVIINLMPGWIDRSDDLRSQSGSIYRHDRHIPLIFYGQNIPQGDSRRRVDPIDVTPTLARIMDIEQPAATEGMVLEEVIGAF